MNQILFTVFLLKLLITGSPIPAQKKYSLRWSVATSLPVNQTLGKQPGLAGIFTGFINNELIIAGGSNFPGSMPWQGGKKVYWSDIYILHIEKNKKYNWENGGRYKLNESIAYGASVQLKEGIVCIGGENATGISKKVFLLHGNDGTNKISIADLPDLPLPLTNLSATSIGSEIFVAGGETVTGVSDHFFKLNFHQPDKGWIELARVPVEISHAVMLVQLKDYTSFIYLLGGRKKNENGISDIYSSCFEYNIAKDEWVKKKDMPYAVSAGLGIAGQPGEILYIGGDRGETFHKVESVLAAINTEADPLKRQQLTAQKNQLQIDHPGFNKEILAYNIEMNEWRSVGRVPFDTPVTTTIVRRDHKFYIPCGEIRAGIRTSQVLILK